MPIIVYFARSIERPFNYVYCGCKNKRNMNTNIFVYIRVREEDIRKKKGCLSLNDY